MVGTAITQVMDQAIVTATTLRSSRADFIVIAITMIGRQKATPTTGANGKGLKTTLRDYASLARILRDSHRGLRAPQQGAEELAEPQHILEGVEEDYSSIRLMCMHYWALLQLAISLNHQSLHLLQGLHQQTEKAISIHINLSVGGLIPPPSAKSVGRRG